MTVWGRSSRAADPRVGLSCTMPLKRALLDLGSSASAQHCCGRPTFLFGTPDEPSRVENTDVDGVWTRCAPPA